MSENVTEEQARAEQSGAAVGETVVQALAWTHPWAVAPGAARCRVWADTLRQGDRFRRPEWGITQSRGGHKLATLSERESHGRL